MPQWSNKSFITNLLMASDVGLIEDEMVACFCLGEWNLSSFDHNRLVVVSIIASTMYYLFETNTYLVQFLRCAKFDELIYGVPSIMFGSFD